MRETVRTWLGICFFTTLMTAGYYYNLTFVQLGLHEVATRIVGPVGGSVFMAGLALTTVMVALFTGYRMQHAMVGLTKKLRLTFFAVLVQLILTMTVTTVHNAFWLATWGLFAAVGLGVGIPATFSMTVDFVPRQYRGGVAGLITALAFAVAVLYPVEWDMTSYSTTMTVLMLPAVLLVGYFAWSRTFVVWYEQSSYADGWYAETPPARLYWLVAAMFAVFFLDSFGFLRILDTPALALASWQSPVYATRVSIALAHIVSAGAAAVIYTYFRKGVLFTWVVGIFALTHLLYLFDSADPSGALAAPLLYAGAVSFYTVITFALWADCSDARTVPWRTAVGVGVAGWSATFLSTAAVMVSNTYLTRTTHFRLTSALSLLFLVVVAGFVYFNSGFRLLMGEGV